MVFWKEPKEEEIDDMPENNEGTVPWYLEMILRALLLKSVL